MVVVLTVTLYSRTNGTVRFALTYEDRTFFTEVTRKTDPNVTN